MYINNRLTHFPVLISLFLALMSTLINLETIPPDLTGKVKYETADRIDGGHAQICKGILTNSQGTVTEVRLLLPRHFSGYMATQTRPGCGEGHHSEG